MVIFVFIFMPKVKCPTCKRETEWKGNEFRPFCSQRCKLLDFGAWVDGKFAVPTQDAALSEKDLDELEKVLAEKEKVN